MPIPLSRLTSSLPLTTKPQRNPTSSKFEIPDTAFFGSGFQLKMDFGQRFRYVAALVLGDEVLLGTVPTEDMDLVVSPGRREVITVDPP